MGILVEHGHDISGTTAQRPTNADVGCKYFDTTLGTVLFWSGTAWVTSDGAAPAAIGAGTAAGTGVTAAEYGDAAVHKTVLTLANLAVTITDATTAGGHGAQKVYDFPQGLIEIVGATMDLTTAAGTGGIADTAALVASLGTATVGTDNATLTSTEADILPSTEGTLSDGAGTLKGKTLPNLATLSGISALSDSSGGATGNNTIAAITNGANAGSADVAPVADAIADLAAKINEILAATVASRRLFDGTGTAKDVYLNLAIPDAGMTDGQNDTLTLNGTITLTWINHGDV